MAVLGSLNQSRVVSGPAQIYLAAYPSGGYTGGTDALRVTTLKSLFFSDAATDACRTLIPSIYSELDASGVDIKLKQASIDFDPNMGGKYKAASGPSELTVTWSFKDIDINKIMDAFGAVAGDAFTTNYATGVAGRKSVLVGRQGAPLKVAILIRYPSSEFAGEFENIYIPMATLSSEWEIKLDKRNVAVVKLTAEAITDASLQGTQAMPPIALIDNVTHASS